MAKTKYYFQVNASGEPIEGSNIRSTRPPRSLGRMRWKEFKTLADKCCDDDVVLETGIGRHKRYWVRVDPDTNLPISMTLMKRKIKPAGHWQEVVGIHDCSLVNLDPTFVQTITSNPQSFNIFAEMGRTGLTADVETDLDTDGNLYVVDVDANGDIDVAIVDDTADATDTFTVRVTNGCTHKLIEVTLEYIAP